MATAISFNDILNFLIPICVWIFLGWILYLPFKTPIDALFSKIKEWREGRDNESMVEKGVKSIAYE